MSLYRFFSPIPPQINIFASVSLFAVCLQRGAGQFASSTSIFAHLRIKEND
jgi:hypothetical protein